MGEVPVNPLESIRADRYTVLGFCHETWERWAWQCEAASPDMAEDIAHMEMHRRGYTLGVAAVVEGYVDTVDPHRWVDPSVTTQDQMDVIRRETGHS
ncbi:MAG: hypothetical protein M3Z02_04055 [Actinomycetota bacterium]|nr:hypothetical protein [Actinomycetota bacterium]